MCIMCKLFLCGAFLLLENAGASRAQGKCKAIESAESKLYGFQPVKLSKDEKTRKSAQLDAYWWLLVGKAGPHGATCLGTLRAKQSDGFALFDESQLLLSVDKSHALDQ